MAKKSGKLAKRYAKALLSSLQHANETPALAGIAEDLTAFAKAWQDQPVFHEAILNPMFTREERRKALLGVCKHVGLSEILTNFVLVLFDRDRLYAVVEIAASFSELADSAAGLVRVEVITASSPSADEVQKIENDVQKYVQAKPVFTWKVNPALLGGLIVSFNGKVLDGSVSGRLERMARSLS